MKKIKEVIIVEGRYDKNTLAQLVDAVIIETSGFGIFNDKQKLSLIRRMAEKCGVILLTDSDGAGFVIRNYLKGALPAGQVKHAFIPDIQGKERRKLIGGKEGKLGVEGMSGEVLMNALIRAGATFEDTDSVTHEAGDSVSKITKNTLYEAGLYGGIGSAEKRRVLAHKLNLPEKLSAGMLADVLNALFTPDEFIEMMRSESISTNG